MTPEQRIERHQKTIEFIRDDIAWLKETRFSIGSGPHLQEINNAKLIERQEENLRMYERFIVKLKEQNR